jgi:hypothetical protein
VRERREVRDEPLCLCRISLPTTTSSLVLGGRRGRVRLGAHHKRERRRLPERKWSTGSGMVPVVALGLGRDE